MITIKQAQKITQLSRKTLLWFYNKVFKYKLSDKKQYYFTAQDINYIHNLQMGIFDKKHQLQNIPNFSRYWASPTGDIYTYKRNFFEKLKFTISHGYYYVTLYNDIKQKYGSYRVHRIIAYTFVPNIDFLKYPIINHKNGIKTDNNIDNLEWTHISYNTKHAYQLNLIHNSKGEEDSQSFIILVTYTNNQQVKYGSLGEAERFTGISKSNFSRWLKSHKGSSKFQIMSVELIER